MFWNRKTRDSGMQAATFTMNGKTYTGKSIRFHNGILEVDGVVVDGEAFGKPLEISILEGTSNIEVSGDLVCGDINGAVSVAGDLRAGNITGPVSAEGDIQCRDVVGPVHAEGDITAHQVQGSLTAGGDISTR